jgi:hypothetical protein
LFLARGLREQGGIVPDQDAQVQAISEIQVRETPVIDLMQDAFYSRAKADEPRRCAGCRHAAEATEATEAAA